MVFVSDCNFVVTIRHIFRVVQDGPGSLTVFNGPFFMTDMMFTRANRYVSGKNNSLVYAQNSVQFYGATYSQGCLKNQ